MYTCVLKPLTTITHLNTNRINPIHPCASIRTQVRYHNSEPVYLPKGNNSNKYIVEKLTPDWDGGSRGKVKTKGKRGPGFV